MNIINVNGVNNFKTIAIVLVFCSCSLFGSETKKSNYKIKKFLDTGATFGPETIIGPRCSGDFYLFEKTPFYFGPNFGIQFPAGTLCVNLGGHLGFLFDPFLFEASFTALSMLNPEGGSSSQHYTINLKLGVRIGQFFIKIGPGFFLHKYPFAEKIFPEINGIPINFELGWSIKLR